MKKTFLAIAAGLGLALISGGAVAQDYPNKPIRLIHGFAPGGNADTVGRIIAQALSEDLETEVVVDPRPGAGGNIAAAAVSKAAPDGYTLLVPTGGNPVAGALYNKLPYEPLDGFEWVSTATVFPFLLVVRDDSNFTSLQDLIAAAKTKPGAITYGSAGVGTTHHLTVELLASEAGIKVRHVPYRGDAAAMTALLSGDIDFAISAPTSAISHLDAGTARAIAVTGANRWQGDKSVPTVQEQGIAGFDVTSWIGLAATAGTPKAVVERLHAALSKGLQQPALRERIETVTGGEAQASASPAAMRERVSTELQRWNQVIDNAGIERR